MFLCPTSYKSQSKGLKRAGMESESGCSGAGIPCHAGPIYGERSNTYKHHLQTACNMEDATAEKCASNQLYLSLPTRHRLRMHNPVHLFQNTNRTWIPGNQSKSEHSIKAEIAKLPFPDLSLIWADYYWLSLWIKGIKILTFSVRYYVISSLEALVYISYINTHIYRCIISKHFLKWNQHGIKPNLVSVKLLLYR